MIHFEEAVLNNFDKPVRWFVQLAFVSDEIEMLLKADAGQSATQT